ncbi:MAG: MoaD/ThiS family protein [Spirochaetes bacterium]|nr:MoaD/ThiS family protein [Spirochaetota bacterium]
MEVKVKLYTLLKKYGEGKIGNDGLLSLPEDETLQGLSEYLSIPKKRGKVFLVNGMPKDAKHRLCNGDEVKILSFIGGG